VQRTAAALVVGPGHQDGAVVVARDRDRLGDGQFQRTLGPLDRQLLAVDGYVDAGRNRHRLLTNTRHG